MLLRIFVIWCVLGLMACKGKVHDMTSEVTVFISSNNCTFDQTIANHPFRAWPAADADKYDCPLFAKMNCSIYVGSEASEIRCEGINPADPQNAPSDCAISHTGTRLFFSGNLLIAAGYLCDSRAGLSCGYSKHSPNPCTLGVDCGVGESPILEENLQCS